MSLSASPAEVQLSLQDLILELEYALMGEGGKAWR
jgi:hypothetical protein